MDECKPGSGQERFALPVRASAHSGIARRSKANLTEQNISGVRYMNYKERHMREGFQYFLDKLLEKNLFHAS
jgi:hypothetical protein